MVEIKLTFATLAEAAKVLALAAGAQVTVVAGENTKEAPGKPPAASPAPSPRTAKAAADAPATSTTAQEPQPPTAPAAAATSAAKPAEVTQEQLAALIGRFVPNPKHKEVAVALIASYKAADGAPAKRGKDIPDADRPSAYAALQAKATELGIKID